MKRFLVLGMILALSLAFAGTVFGANVIRMKSGLNYVNPELAQPGYPMFMYPYDGGSMIMIDLYGNMVHHWHAKNTNGTGNSMGWPLLWDNGDMIVDMPFKSNGAATISDPLVRGARSYDALFQLDWSSNLVGSSGTALFSENYAPHHDGKKIWNKALGEYTWLALGWQAYSASDAVALGVDPVYESGYEGGWSPDCVLEVDAEGNLVWRWSFADHYVQKYDATKVNAFVDSKGYPNPGAIYGEPADHPEKLNINVFTDNLGGPRKDYLHCNSMDYNPGLGQIVINAKNMSEIYVIDHDNTFVSTTDFEANWAAAQGAGGDFMYRFGNPYNYDRGAQGGYRDEGNHQFFGAHNIHWIGTGSMYPGFEVFDELEGAGNMLIFDNNCWNPNINASVVLEWNPYANADGVDTGDYVDPADAGYNTSGTLNGYSKQVVWKYEAGTGFYGNHISGMQRMPNGNTHICEGTESHFFEVTSGGILAWEYYKPNTQNPELSTGGNFRSNKAPAGHPALDGRDLSPKGNFRDIVIEERRGSHADTQLKKFLGTL